MNSRFQPLFEPFTFRSGVTVKNRVLMAPMTNFASHQNGEVSDEELAYYRVRSGGVGAVVTACVYVTLDGKGFYGEFGADTDEMIPSLRRLADTIHAEGAKAILQIYHGGRLSPVDQIPDGTPLSASAVPAEQENAPVPREMTEEDIQRVIAAYGEATRRAIEAGYDGVEIHGANGYLLQQFFSPHANRRDDAWGGTLEKRMAFPLAVVNSVKEAIAKHARRPFILGYRLSPEEGHEPGITFEDTLQLVDRLADQEMDYLHISVNHFFGGSFRDRSQTESRTVLIHEKVGSRVTVIGVGSLDTPEEAVKALETGVPLVALGRPLLMDPEWVQKAENGKEDSIRTTISKQAQEELVIPDVLWGALVNTPGWMPVVD
ncbi:NADH-dependent flavin oxidoreductase [Paenibacillus sp. JX-17]|uniref:NADH-dependent flavin oxidoreductase n=1 Tax=Paenibacillus lacisoli TaxID=3064525 RepID=A0ABT9CAY5_9BACL|nr:NADH-dependent flavin oxidoreductase [Paenibacillus sp. JX-17]MDO7906425.1 NADH-dependent flavin oxidoreductase [Paenibacillus sp. JX-17]